MQEIKQEFDYIQIKLASPIRIRSWGQRILPNGQIIGEIKKAETINYRTLKPEMDGLFCERIFGPIKNWECHCGKYKQVYHQGLICDRCGVEVTESHIRRHRMGYIDLISPVTHLWYLKSTPSFLGLILGQTKKELEKKIYFNSDNLADEKNFNNYFKSFKTKNIMGAELIEKELEKLDLMKIVTELREEVISFSNLDNKQLNPKKEKIIKRIRVLENFIATDSNPAWMLLSVLPVIPAGLRPMTQLDGGRFTTSDINELYRRILIRNNRLLHLFKIKAPEIIVRNEKRMLQEAVDALIDNDANSTRKSVDANNRPFKSLSDLIKGKQGRFRQNLLGKRVDYSGRSVIIVDPTLTLNQCGLPYEIAIELFKPFVIHDLIRQKLTTNIKTSEKFISKNKTFIENILQKILINHPILLNRAPTLHRLGVQAFEPILIEGRAIHLHPLVCTAFNADFDGDQMAVHVPLSLEAQTEAYTLMLAPYNFLSPATGEPLLLPSQDMVLGCYYLTLDNIPKLPGSNHYFTDFSDVLLAYNNNKLDLHSLIWVRYEGICDTSLKLLKTSFLKNGMYLEQYENFQQKRDKNGKLIVQYLQTTVGRIIFNNTIKKTLNLI